VRPQRVLTSSPERFYERIGASHPDHMTVGESTLRAVYPDARNPFAWPELLADEGLEAWSVRELWLMAAPDERVNHVVDTTETIERKVAALRAHVSQTAHMTDLEERMRSLGTLWAQRFGLPEGHVGEGFQTVSIG
jgi:LmbE family N-acetylglucosaminyl deacetylase